MLEPKEFPLDGKTYVLSKFSAVKGREIILQYPTSAMPKVGDYATNEALMYQIMKHVGVAIPGREEPLVLSTPQLVDAHVKSAETLMKLEFAMLNYNFDFFTNGFLSGILARVGTQAAQSIQKILMDLSRVSSEKQGAAAQP